MPATSSPGEHHSALGARLIPPPRSRPPDHAAGAARSVSRTLVALAVVWTAALWAPAAGGAAAARALRRPGCRMLGYVAGRAGCCAGRRHDPPRARVVRRGVTITKSVDLVGAGQRRTFVTGGGPRPDDR